MFRLPQRGITVPVRLARRHGVTLRQSYLRVSGRAKREAARLMSSPRPHQAERQVRRLRTWLGRLARDIARKVVDKAETAAACAPTLDLVGRLPRQRREDRGSARLYSLHAPFSARAILCTRHSLHAPEVACIGKGKARARFAFGVKVSIATTKAAAPGGQCVLGARALPANPDDGHTLTAQIAQIA